MLLSSAPSRLLILRTFPVAGLQPGPRRLKATQCLEFGYKDTYCAVPVLLHRGICLKYIKGRTFVCVASYSPPPPSWAWRFLYSYLQRPLLGSCRMCERAATSVQDAVCKRCGVIVILALLPPLLRFHSGPFCVLSGIPWHGACALDLMRLAPILIFEKHV